MIEIVFMSQAWEDYLYWQETVKKQLQKINIHYLTSFFFNAL